MGNLDIPIEFQIDVDNVSEELRTEAENRLIDLTEGNTDLLGAAIHINQTVQTNGPNTFRVRIVVCSRPEHIVASKEEGTVEAAMKASLDAIERQVREKRKKLGQPWKRPGLSETTGGQ